MRGDLLAPPLEGGSIAAASRWVEELLRGQLAAAIAVMAIALLGYGMMSSRISVRDALKVIIGCFILFGSPTISRALIGTIRGTGEASPPSLFVHSSPSPLPLPLPSAPPETNANPFDPYSNNLPPN